MKLSEDAATRGCDVQSRWGAGNSNLEVMPRLPVLQQTRESVRALTPGTYWSENMSKATRVYNNQSVVSGGTKAI